MQASTGLRNYIGSSGSCKAALDAGFLKVWTVPTDPTVGPDDALTGATLLGTFTESGDGTTGLTWDSAVNGALPKAAAETWKTTWAASGTAVLFRFCEAGDAGDTASTTAKRVQGTVGIAGADLTMSNNVVTSGADFTLDSAEIDFT